MIRRQFTRCRHPRHRNNRRLSLYFIRQRRKRCGIIVTKLFQFYVAKYDRYNPTYLALASIIMLMTWMYLTCLLLLLGGKLNAILRRERERATNAPTATPQPA